jgi:hypothetical protein
MLVRLYNKLKINKMEIIVLSIMGKITEKIKERLFRWQILNMLSLTSSKKCIYDEYRKEI